MWKKFVKDYLSFTKKDRIGVIVLVVLIFLIVLLPYIWPAKKAIPLNKQETEKLRLQLAQLNKTDDTASLTLPVEKYHSAPYNDPPEKNAVKNNNTSLFYFDPNTLSVAGWRSLGLHEKTAGTIVHYVLKGGRFRQPQDIGKIYGLHKNEYERLLPYVKIESRSSDQKINKDKEYVLINKKPAFAPKQFYVPKPVEINSADTTAFIALPGIGSKLAARIINFREKLGGFYSVQQVGETYALPDSTFSKIQGMLQCNRAEVKQLNINTADVNALRQHPYIRWNLANAIVQYRMQHGNFTSVDDLQMIELITPEIFKKIKPYLQVQ